MLKKEADVLKIAQTVGMNGRNRPEDVVVVQYMLRRLPRFKNGKLYYRGKLDGFYSGQTTSAIQQFYEDLPAEIRLSGSDLREYKRNVRTFTPDGILFKMLSSWVSDDLVVKSGKAIPGTSFLYISGNHQKPVSRQGDFLIPDTMPLPAGFQVGGQVFDTKIEAVSIDLTDRFRVELSLVGIKCIIDPATLKQQALRASRPLLGQVDKNLLSTVWQLARDSHANVTNSIDIVSRQPAKLIQTHRDIIDSGFFPRALEQQGAAINGVRIPSRQQMTQILTNLYTAVCVGKDRLPPGVTIDAKVQKLVSSVVRKAPDIDSRFVERHCQSCEKLAQSNDAAWKRAGEILDTLQVPAMREDIQKLEESRRIIAIAAKDTSGIGDAIGVVASVVRQAAKINPRFILNPVGLAKGAIQLELGDVVDLTHGVAQKGATSRSTPAAARATLRSVARLTGFIGVLLLVADAVKAAMAIAQDERSIGEQFQDFFNRVSVEVSGELNEAIAFMRDRGDALAIELQNIALQLEGQRVILEANGHAMERMQCLETYYIPSKFNVHGT